MLNEVRKKCFIDADKFQSFDTRSVNNINTTLELFGEYEDIIDKDICDWTLLDIKNAFTLLNTTSAMTLMNYKSRLSAYTNWCIKNSLSNTNQNNFENFTQDLIEQCVNETLAKIELIQRNDLLDKLKLLLNYRDKFLVLALYEGIGSHKGICNGEKHKMLWEFDDLTIDSFDVENKTVSLSSGRVLSVSDELIEYAIETDKSEEYYSRTSKILKDGKEVIVHKRRMEDRRLIWSVLVNRGENDTAADTTFMLIQNILYKICNMKLSGFQSMTATKIVKAGRYYYTKINAEKSNISALEYNKLHEDEINYRFGTMSVSTENDYLKLLERIETENK